MTQVLQKGISFWRQYFINLLCEKLPSRIKRLIFLSSIMGVVERVDTPDQEMLSKLNTVLKLAHKNDALLFPMYIHSWLWKNCQVKDCINIDGRQVQITSLTHTLIPQSSFGTIAEYLISKAPKWIIYDSTQAIAKDLQLMFDSFSNPESQFSRFHH